MTHPNLPGHEHFGFKDGVSQPGIRDDRVTPLGQADRQAGQDRVCPGEFIIGYPCQAVSADREGTGGAEGDQDEEQEESCADAGTPLPDWTRNGSYLVFRRLRQDVGGFQDFVRQKADDLGLKVDLLGAKLVGRYASGAPLAPLRNPAPGVNQPPAPGAGDDPGRLDPQSPLLSDRHINDFEFMQGDAHGEFVPRSAHIRKVYPRDQRTPGEPAADNVRILRRGIPFGSPYRREAPGEDRDGGPLFPNDRGLLFICYQNSIKDKFEVLQQRWANSPTVPAPAGGVSPGEDPIISQAAKARQFDIPGVRDGHITLLQRWVTTTGGDYFFSPAIEALYRLASDNNASPAASEVIRTGEEPTMSAQTTPGTGDASGSTFPFIGAGVCKLQITVAVSDMAQAMAVLQNESGTMPAAVRAMRKPLWQPPRGSYPWRVLINEMPVWESNDYNELIITATGVAVGSALIHVRRLLEALAALKPGIKGDEILEIAKSDNPHATGVTVVGKEYHGWELQVYIGNAWSGTWPKEGEENPLVLEFPIDMGVSGGGK